MDIRRVSAVLALALVLLTPAASRAAILNLGIKAGANYTDLTGDVTDTEKQAGFVGGGVLSVGLSPTFALQAEGLFSMKGAKVADVQIDLSYLDVPVLLRADLLPGTIKPYLYGGADFGFKLSGTAESGGVSNDLNNLNPVDYGFAVGGGVKFPLMGLNPFGDIRYTQSLSDATDAPEGNFKIACWTLSVGVMF